METDKELTINNEVEINACDSDMLSSFFGYYNDCYTKEQLMQYILYPMNFHKQLMDVSEKMYNRNGILGQTISKMVAAPSLDAVIIPRKSNASSKKKLSEVYNIMNSKINHKLSSRDLIFNSLLYGEYVAIWRDTKKKNVERPKEYAGGKNIEGVSYVDNVMLQPLDLRYCRFEGFANGDYVVSFDMQYFDQFHGTALIGEIKNYPREFLIAYNAYKKDASKKWMLLPQESTFAFKYHGAINESHGRPLALFALLDILFSEDYTDSQRNNMYENASTIRWMELPESERKGACSLSKDQQANQYNAFKNAVRAADTSTKNRLGGTTTLKLAPGTKIGKLENADTFLKNTLTEENDMAVSTSLGLALAALNGGNSGSNFSTLSVNIELMLSEIFSILEQASFQYTKLINNYLGVTKYENGYDFFYLNTSTINSNKQFEKYKELFTLASGSRTLLYSACCGNADLYLKLMDFEKSEGFDNKYPPHQTAFTNSGKTTGDKGGRQESDSETLSPQGQQTRTNGGNNMPKPSTTK